MPENISNFIYLLEILFLLAIFIPTVIAFVIGAPWVPTPMARVRRVLELAKIKPGQRIYDLGCGDGRFVQTAAREYGADAVGLELSPIVYAWARIRNFFMKSKARILMRDFRGIDYSNASALVFYLLPDILKTMRPKFEKELKPGARVVSYAFEVEGWTPVYSEPRDRSRGLGPIFVYEMPTSVNANGNEAKK